MRQRLIFLTLNQTVRMRTAVVALSALLLCTACNTGKERPAGNADTAGTAMTTTPDSVRFTTENIPAERTTVNHKPVKQYTETVKSFATTDVFKVRLFETKRTFKYLIKIAYKEMNVEDTLRLPNFGTEPLVEIRKGDSIRPSCIVGFYDKEQKFRESKLIYFAGNKLKVKVLKHYTIYQQAGD